MDIYSSISLKMDLFYFIPFKNKFLFDLDFKRLFEIYKNLEILQKGLYLTWSNQIKIYVSFEFELNM